MVGNVVFQLTRMLMKHKRFKVFFDNFFSSVNLLKLLMDDGLLAVATLHKDRMKGAEQSLTSVKELKRKGWVPMTMQSKLTQGSQLCSGLTTVMFNLFQILLEMVLEH